MSVFRRWEGGKGGMEGGKGRWRGARKLGRKGGLMVFTPMN